MPIKPARVHTRLQFFCIRFWVIPVPERKNLVETDDFNSSVLDSNMTETNQTQVQVKYIHFNSSVLDSGDNLWVYVDVEDREVVLLQFFCFRFQLPRFGISQ